MQVLSLTTEPNVCRQTDRRMDRRMDGQPASKPARQPATVTDRHTVTDRPRGRHRHRRANRYFIFRYCSDQHYSRCTRLSSVLRWTTLQFTTILQNLVVLSTHVGITATSTESTLPRFYQWMLFWVLMSESQPRVPSPHCPGSTNECCFEYSCRNHSHEYRVHTAQVLPMNVVLSTHVGITATSTESTLPRFYQWMLFWVLMSESQPRVPSPHCPGSTNECCFEYSCRNHSHEYRVHTAQVLPMNVVLSTHVGITATSTESTLPKFYQWMLFWVLMSESQPWVPSPHHPSSTNECCLQVAQCLTLCAVCISRILVLDRDDLLALELPILGIFWHEHLLHSMHCYNNGPIYQVADLLKVIHHLFSVILS